MPREFAPASLEARAALHAALGEPARLAIVDELAHSDRTPKELGRRFGLPSNLLAHHLDVLERVGLISRRQSSGDGRRRYVRVNHRPVVELERPNSIPDGPVLFVCTGNSARSPLAAALWSRVTGRTAWSAGTHPARGVHPKAVASARRIGLDLSRHTPRSLDEIGDRADLVITVCDEAHEELGDSETRWHWSVADPVADGSAKAFDLARDDLSARMRSLAAPSSVERQNDAAS